MDMQPASFGMKENRTLFAGFMKSFCVLIANNMKK